MTLYAHWKQQSQQGRGEYELSLQINNPYLTVNGDRIPIDNNGTTPIIVNNRTLLPLRAVIEAVGGTVDWDANSRTVSLDINGRCLDLQIGSTSGWDEYGNVVTSFDTAPMIYNGRTLLPIRAVIEYYGGDVYWDSNSRTVTIYMSVN